MYNVFKLTYVRKVTLYTVEEDPGFPVGGGTNTRWGVPTPAWVLFSKNVCENKRIGSGCGEGAPETFVCRSATIL